MKDSRTMKIIGYNQEIELEIIDEYGENFETRYIHPQTGSSCQEIEQIKYGWSFQSNTENENYQRLINSIKEMEADNMTFDWVQDTEVLNIHDTPYGV